jgi:hypothetical protein
MSLTLRELLDGWGNGEQIIRSVHLPESETVTACLKIVTSDTLRPPQNIDMEQIKKKLVVAAERNDFSHISPTEWRYSPFALDGSGGPAASVSLLQRYLHGLSKYYNKQRAFRALASTYVRTFKNKSDLTNCLGTFLSTYSASAGSAWILAHERYSIFNPEKAPGILAKHLETQAGRTNYSIADFVKTENLPQILTFSPLALAAVQQALASITHNYTRPADDRDIERIRKLTSTDQGALAFQGVSSLVTALTDALLLPFHRSAPRPDPQKMIVGYLLQHLGDPRIHTARWSGVRLESKNVILRWLTEQSLELFLDIVDRVVLGAAAARHMWAKRASFWRSYLKAGYIDTAWVVLGRECRQYAEQSGLTNGVPLAFGRLSASDCRHAVLMMRIDSLTIVDWSHNGKCHIWYGSNTKAPSLYIVNGNKEQLEQLSDESFWHDPHGAWREKVASVIYRHTGRPMP